MKLAKLTTASGLLALIACDALPPGSYDAPPRGVGDTSGDDSGDAVSEDDTSDGGCADFDGVIEGTVRVERYTINGDGDTEPMEWGDDEAFSFGFIYVAAYTVNELNDKTYYANAHISEPTTGGDAFSLDISDAEEGVRLYAALDADEDRIIGSWDPIGNYPEVVIVCGGETVDDVEITIMVSVDSDGNYTGGWGSYGSSGSGGSGSGGSGSGSDGGSGSGSDGGSGGSGSGGSGGSGSGGSGGAGDSGLDTGDTGEPGPTTISGDALITTSYAGGEAAVMLLDTAGVGPYLTDWTDPDVASASAPYLLEIMTDYGDMQLVGAWDNNENGFIEPTDTWGVYAVEPGTEGNPISVLLGESLEEHDVEIPLQGGDLSLTPFVTISGSVRNGDGSFDDYEAGSAVYVAALKYRPQADLSVDDLYKGYDVSAFEDPTGDSLGFELVVPAHGVVYLWVYGDLDGDGIIQETDEPVVAVNSDDGRVSTEDASIHFEDALELRVPGSE